MKHFSFKTKTAFLITLLVAAVCAISLTGLLSMSRSVAGMELQKSLIRAVERNADEVEYKNGILDVEEDFVLFGEGIYCCVYSLDGQYLCGDVPAALINAEGLTDSQSGSFTVNGETYLTYDSLLSFNRYEYEIDVFTGHIIDCEIGCAPQEGLEPCTYPSTRFAKGISTARAVEIALQASGFSEKEVKMLAVDLPAYGDRQVFRIAFIAPGSSCEGVWIRGIAPAGSTGSAFNSITRSVVYVIPAILLLAALGAYWVARRTIRPVEQITAAAGEINSGSDLTKRIEIGRGEDEIHTLADTFNAMFARLQDSFRAEKQFTSDASHELRTPLAVIKAESEYALSDMSEENAVEALTSIGEQAEKMNALISTLLMLTRADREARTFHLEPCDLSVLFEGICREFKPEKDITLLQDIQPGIIFSCEPVLIGMILKNLLSNAVKYGKEKGTVSVMLKKDEAHIVLTVRDDGQGMKPEELQNIFERFYRTDEARLRAEGFGLGLSLCQRAAALHNGCIRAESEYGKGSVFTVTFNI